MDGCTLCGLPTGRNPVARRFDDGELNFCCFGCANVYTILRESGLAQPGVDFRETELFRESLRLGLISTQKERTRPVIPPDAETREAAFQLSGLWCTACGWVIEQAVEAEPGIVSAECSSPLTC